MSNPMMNLIKTSLLILVMTVVSTASMAEVLDRETALQRLDSMSAALEALPRTGLHSQDAGRMFLIQSAVSTARQTITEVGVGHMRAVNALQNLLARFRYSNMFFTFIRTRRNAVHLASLLDSVTFLRTASGVGENPFSLVIQAHLEQLGQAIRQLKNQGGLSAELRAGCTALLSPVGHAIAAVSMGDKPDAEALRELTALRAKVNALYPELNRALSVASAAPLALEVMGINEFLGEVTSVELP